MNQRTRVYAWEFPVRLTHWLNMLSILTLAVTGFYIGAPFMHAYAASQYIMGTIRAVHFISGYVLLFSMIVRVYWAFAGNRYASWRVWFPYSGRRLKDLIETIKFYSFMSRKPPYAVGHTALAGASYLFVFLIFGYMIVSGFAMYGLSRPQSAVMTLLGGWLLGIMDLQSIRLWHHMGMYAILVFVGIHLYIAWWLDTVERNGVMGSIFGGYKFVSGKEWE